LLGAAIVVWTAQFRMSLSRIRDRLARRGGNADRIDRLLDARWLPRALALVAVLGVVIIVLGAFGSE